MRNIHTHIVHPLEEEVVSLYENFPQCLDLSSCSLGLHPWYLEQAERDWEVLQQYATYSHVMAIGECGLDKVCGTPWERQQQYFQLQIGLANRLNKPLIIHCVKAYAECMAELQAAKVPVVFHGFNKSIEPAQMLLSKGYYLSFGHSLFREGYGDILNQVPPERIFLETDDKTDISIEDVYKRAAELLNFPLDALILQLEKNYQNIL
jgi:TatD DNase family protein